MNSFIRKEGVPDALLTAPLDALAGLLGGPTIFYLEGRHRQPLFLSTLLHGNEPSGMLGLQQILSKYQGQKLPRSLILLIGNVAAAERQVRMLPGQPDFNRIWKQHPSPIGQAASELLAELKMADLFAAADIHDNTGTNPHYACVSKTDDADLQLAALFNHVAVHFTYPDTALSVNLSAFCPAVTLECGKAGTSAGVDNAATFIEALLHLDHLPQRTPGQGDLTIFRAVARMKVRSDLAIETGSCAVPGKFILPPDLDHLNFSELKPGRVLGFSTDPGSLILDSAPGATWCNTQNQCVRFEKSQWVVNKTFTPGMLTLSASAIHDDCLGYIMEPM